MPKYIASADGAASSASVWSVVDETSVSYLNDENTSTVLTTSYVESAPTTPGAITIDGIAVKVARRVASPTGTITVRLAQAGATVAGTEVTINVSDIPYGVGIAADTQHNGWIFFKFAAPVLLVVATAYTVSAKTSSASQVHLWRNATAGNWNRMLRTTTFGSIIAGDDFHVLGEWTAAATVTARAVTWDITATTDFGSTSTTLASVSVGVGGTLTWAAVAATAYIMRLSGLLDICTGGAVNMGTTGTPCPRDSSMELQFDNAADGNFGMRVYGSFSGQGQSRLSGVTDHYALLNTDEAIGQTVLGLDRQLSAASGDAVALGSTTRTVTQSEDRLLSGDAGASSVTVTVGLTNAHSGTAPAQGIIVGLSRAVRLVSVSTSFMTYVQMHTGATVDCDWMEFRYCGSSAASNKNGIVWLGSSGSINFNKCVSRDSDHSGWYCILTGGVGEFTITDCVAYRFAVAAAGNGFYINEATSNVWTVTGCVAIGINTSATGFWWNDIGGTFTDCWASSCQIGIRFGELTSNIAGRLTGTFARLTSQSTNSTPFSFESMHSGTLTDLTAWRGSGIGLSFGSVAIYDIVIDGAVLFGNGTSNIGLSTTTGPITLRGITSNGDSSFTTTIGLTILAAHMMPVRVESCNFSTASGILTAHGTADINLGTSSMRLELTLVNTTLAGATEISNTGSIVGKGFIAYQKDEGVSLDNRKHYPALGTVSRDTVTIRTAPSSEKLEPASALSKLPSTLKRVIVQSGQIATVSVYINKGVTYNGNSPRLRVRENAACGIAEAVLATHAGVAGSWIQVTGATGAVSETGILEFEVEVDGTAGQANVQDWSAVVA